LLNAATPSADTFLSAATWISFPSNVNTPLKRALQRRSALAAMVSKTGWASVRDVLMMRRISPVAACCSIASASG
jgi:hypothetical protein